MKTSPPSVDDILSKSTSAARFAHNDDLRRTKLEKLLSSAVAVEWVNTFPCLPELFVDFISTKNLDQFVTYKCLTEMWKHSMNQESEECPDVTPVADLFQVAEMEQRKPWPALPYNSLSSLHEGAYWPDYDESN